MASSDVVAAQSVLAPAGLSVDIASAAAALLPHLNFVRCFVRLKLGPRVLYNVICKPALPPHHVHEEVLLHLVQLQLQLQQATR